MGLLRLYMAEKRIPVLEDLSVEPSKTKSHENNAKTNKQTNQN